MLPCACAQAAATCALNESRSQFGEDLLLLPTLLRLSYDRPGVFVEMGAFDGVTYSNTIMLEKCFRWNGFLIEANPANFATLRRSGRKAAIAHSAVCDPPGVINMTVAGANVAGDVRTMSEQHARRWAPKNAIGGVVGVSCQPMLQLLSAHQNGSPLRDDSVDFFSLDVEGAEEAVLRASRMPLFRSVLVEMDGTDSTKDDRVRKLLQATSLEKRRFNQLSQSEFFLRKDGIEVPVDSPLPRLGPIARRYAQYRRFRPSHSQLATALCTVSSPYMQQLCSKQTHIPLS